MKNNQKNLMPIKFENYAIEDFPKDFKPNIKF